MRSSTRASLGHRSFPRSSAVSSSAGIGERRFGRRSLKRDESMTACCCCFGTFRSAGEPYIPTGFTSSLHSRTKRSAKSSAQPGRPSPLPSGGWSEGEPLVAQSLTFGSFTASRRLLPPRPNGLSSHMCVRTQVACCATRIQRAFDACPLLLAALFSRAGAQSAPSWTRDSLAPVVKVRLAAAARTRSGPPSPTGVDAQFSARQELWFPSRVHQSLVRHPVRRLRSSGSGRTPAASWKRIVRAGASSGA